MSSSPLIRRQGMYGGREGGSGQVGLIFPLDSRGNYKATVHPSARSVGGAHPACPL